MKKYIKNSVLGGGLALGLVFASYSAFSAPAVEEPTEPTFYGSDSSSISSAVAIPEDTATYHTSGTVPPEIDPEGETVYERYGNTKQQAVGILEKFEEDLGEEGLSLEDVIYLRVYLTPDKALGGVVDYEGWFEAYGEFFNNEDNPAKPARSTMGVESLVHSDWLIEIEAVAAYPTEEE
ncbi:RidA family protein [Salibacterium aidingense]|uniref:RidA family protein n=1 Tax=Salibacterium aidingense TaxID=384933 RepID=UPI0003FBD914|nr:RidA family protein [Salibacterium aidingense]